MVRVKRETGNNNNNNNNNSRRLRSRGIELNSADNNVINENDDNGINRQRDGGEGEEEEVDDEVVVRRNLRSKYLAVKNLISGDKEDFSSPEQCDRFKSIINQVESLHKHVRNPREQVADAEALLDITSSFLKIVKAQKNEGVTPADFVSCMLRDFGRQDRAGSSADGAGNSILWKDIGLAVSHIFRKGPGCSTMLGPMSAELKIRKTAVRKKHVRPTERARPEELDNSKEEKTDTDKNMSTMFGVLRKYRKVRLENLVLNRISFAQTVENLFTLSFLVKDGRAQIAANESGHFVCPRNAPAAEAVASGKVSYCHFVFRFDFKDWKLMLDSVGEGEELMPHRVPVEADTSAPSESAEDLGQVEPETAVSTTPIRKLSRNRGLVIQEQTVVQDSPESDDGRSRASYLRKGKRRLV